VDLSLKGLIVVVSGILLRALVLGGIAALAWAVVNERRMQRHRRQGVTWGQVTWRRDGGWRREDLFTPEGLIFQRRASKWGLTGTVLLLCAVVLAWIVGLTVNFHAPV
jgi:hypothetical protein